MTTDLALPDPEEPNVPELADLSNARPVDPRRCTAHSARTGKPCKRYAINGGTVCPTHGGSAPQVMEKARKRIAGPILEAAVKRHEQLITNGTNEAAVGAMIRDTYDRVGIGTEEGSGTEGFRELLIRVREYTDR